MTIKHSVPKKMRLNDHEVGFMVNAAMEAPHAVRSMAALVSELTFRRYQSKPTAAGIALSVKACEAFFRSGSESAVEVVIEGDLELSGELVELADEVRHHPDFQYLLSWLVTEVATKSGFSNERIGGLVADRLVSRVVGEVVAADDSEPICAVEDQEIVVCHIPGMSAKAIVPPMTAFYDDISSSLTVKPDNTFRDLLALAGISSSEWIEAVEAYHGVRIDESDDDAEDWENQRASDWSRFHFNPERESMIDIDRLIQAVDSCPHGFTPLLAFTADPAKLIRREWVSPLGIKGGVLGLHDFSNGCGELLRMEGDIALPCKPEQMTVGEGRPNDFKTVHGIDRRSFRAKVAYDLQEEIAASSPKM